MSIIGMNKSVPLDLFQEEEHAWLNLTGLFICNRTPAVGSSGLGILRQFSASEIKNISVFNKMRMIY